MKRAKLTQVPLTRAASADLTDRLLDREGRPPSVPSERGAASKGSTVSRVTDPENRSKRAKAAPKSKAAKPKEAGPKRGGAQAGSAEPAARGLATYVPYRTVEPGPPVTAGPILQKPVGTVLPEEAPAELKGALALAEQAVAALVAAAGAAPARHNLAVRYRLDALAHHFRQVAEFLTARGGG
jgi:hypothetical protein